MARTRFFPVKAFFVVFLFSLVVSALPAAEGRPISPPPGPASYQVAPSELLELFVNTSPRPGDAPACQWLVLKVSLLDGIYFLTGKGAVLYGEETDLCAATYPYPEARGQAKIGTCAMASLGLSPGDTLRYAYAYQPEGSDSIVVENVVSLHVASSQGSLARIGSASKMEEYLKEGLRMYSERPGDFRKYGVGVPEAVDGAPAEPAFSRTNVQEAGVDEADLIKTDGRYLYVAAPAGSETPRLLDKFAPEPPGPGGDVPEIRVMELSEHPPSATPVGAISLPDMKTTLDGLYLITERGNDREDLLIAMGGRSYDCFYYWAEPWYWREGVTEVIGYNVATPGEPVRLFKVELEGRMVSSRRIGETLYVVTRFTPNPPDFKPYPAGETELARNRQALERAGLGDLLPGCRVNGKPVGPLVKPSDSFMPPVSEDRLPEPTLITVAAIPLESPEDLVTQTISGPTETVYVSTRSLYLATTRYNYIVPMRGGALETAVVPAPPETTDIHKFSLTEEGPVYRASGTAIGNLGSETDKKPFRMSEYEDVLRIATSLGATWDESSTTRLALFREADGTGGPFLDEISHIAGIGEVGERLYAVRFAGALGYLVTFRMTDPLYIFDLSDPEHPFQAGELHIEGYSDYLHPVNDRWLLGIGKDAVPDESSTDLGGRGAWYQGVKLALFDVSDPSKPTQVDALVIGKRGTDSAALHDHHALAYLPPVGDSPARLALPIQLHDTIPDSSLFDPSEPWAYYDWTHTGLYLFEIFTGDPPGRVPGLEQQGAMIVSRRTDPGPSYPYYSGWTDRAVLLGESAHYVHDARVWSALWAAPEALTGPQ